MTRGRSLKAGQCKDLESGVLLTGEFHICLGGLCLVSTWWK